jgi:nucleotide-binding universal stress UspA family protein
MSNIITATDFSDIADKAVNYACRMAAQLNDSIIVIHAFIIPVAFTDTPMPVMPIEDGKKIADSRMNEYIGKLRSVFPDLNILSQVMYGEIVDCLQEYIDENKGSRCIVMGNSAAEGPSIWTGGTILHALRKLEYPVIAIPENAVYKPVKKICLACDYKEITDKFPLEQLKDLVIETGAELHVLNIGHNSKDITDSTVMETEQLHLYLKDLAPQYHFIDSENVDVSIESFVKSNNMDWLIVIPHKHSFFEKLFHKNHTEALAGISHVPLVALHSK